jgi:hypothetical protein
MGRNFEEFVKKTIAGIDFGALYSKRKNKNTKRDSSPVRHEPSHHHHSSDENETPKKSKRQGRKKDPNAPMKKKGLYFTWANDRDVRAEANRALGGNASGSEIKKKLAELWRTKKGDTEYFKKWQAIVDEDTKRYNNEFDQYKANGSYVPYVSNNKTAPASKPRAVKPVIESSDSESSSE